jgi:hypothetical protein
VQGEREIRRVFGRSVNAAAKNAARRNSARVIEKSLPEKTRTKRSNLAIVLKSNPRSRTVPYCKRLAWKKSRRACINSDNKLTLLFRLSNSTARGNFRELKNYVLSIFPQMPARNEI